MMNALALRVARRFQAETLTKGWLMAVRRGWISVMKAPVSDYQDVLAKFGKLSLFVKNLREQVLNVRRGPMTSLENSDERKQMEARFKRFDAMVWDAAQKAKHWKSAYEGKTIGGEQDRLNGEKMLELYIRDFDSASSGYKEWASRSRQASLTEFLDDTLELLYEDAKRIKKYEEANPDVPLHTNESVFTEFDVHGMKFVIVDGTNGAKAGAYAPRIQEAYDIIRRKGFGSVWYGAILIKGESNKFNEAELQAYRAAGYENLFASAGMYHSGEDIIEITTPPLEYMTETLVHELGHRYWYQKLTRAQRLRFTDLVKTNVNAKPPSTGWDSVPLAEILPESRADDFKEALNGELAVVWTTLNKFKQSKPEYSTKLLDTMSDLFAEKSVRVWSYLTDIPGKFGTWPWEQGLRNQALGKAEELRKKLYSGTEDIQKAINALPDMSRDELDRAYVKKRDQYIEETKDLVDACRDAFFKFLDASLKAKNKSSEQENTERTRQKAVRDKKWLEENPIPTVLPVSDYGKSNEREAFAEVFTYYCYGRDMTRDQIESFKSVISSRMAVFIATLADDKAPL